MPTLRTRMYEFRKAMNIQQSELAELVGVRRETIGKLENGKYNPTLDMIARIAYSLNKKIVISFEDIEE